MSHKSLRTFQSLLLALLGLYLLSRVWSGKILLYINQRFVILIFLAGLGFIILAQVLFSQRQEASAAAEAHQEHNHAGLHMERIKWNFWWILFPVLIGFLIPAKPLGADALPNRGVTTKAALSTRLQDSQDSLQVSPTQRTVLDWIRLFASENDVHQFEGQPVDVTGFVFHDPTLADGQFMVGRFSITCCVADAFAIGMVVNKPGLTGLSDNTWIEVQGKLSIATVNGSLLPVIQADAITPVAEPEQPYLFP